jgi:hypothetical protein
MVQKWIYRIIPNSFPREGSNNGFSYMSLLKISPFIKQTNRNKSSAYNDSILRNGLSLFTDHLWGKLKINHMITTNVPYTDVVEDQQHSGQLQGDLIISQVHKYFPQIHTAERLHRLQIISEYGYCVNDCCFLNTITAVWQSDSQPTGRTYTLVKDSHAFSSF